MGAAYGGGTSGGDLTLALEEQEGRIMLASYKARQRVYICRGLGWAWRVMQVGDGFGS